MTASNAQPDATRHAPPTEDEQLPALVGQVYATAPPSLRASMLEHLLQPLGVLALVAVANGVFAKIRFRSGWPDVHVRLEDAALVQPGDVVALADRALQAGSDAFNGLGRLIASSPVLAGSAAATLLLALLMQHQRHRRASDLG